ncbi:MAG: TetR/AcrR family transcriptional regulator, partial [Lachnospiraceae bacterium]|nr:TetR/AcrR family transcriptional regulator [Lachnospiraceae bacterium]
MKEERETKENLIASAKAEFMEKGYVKASLRKICANAGVTTGALYF